MALKSGSIIRVNEILSPGDYIESPSRLFFAIMLGDGNFAVYRGTWGNHTELLWCAHRGMLRLGNYFITLSPSGYLFIRGPGPESEPSMRDKEWTWWSSEWSSSNKNGALGEFFATVQDDGNLVVYRGTSLEDQQEVWWSSNIFETLVDCEISSIDYDVDASKILHSVPTELYRQEVRNGSMQTQTSSIRCSESASENSGWSDSLAFKIGGKTTFSTGIPILAEGKVELSAEGTNTYTWNSSKTRTKLWEYSTPVSVPPRKVIVALMAVTLSTIVVPYTLKGTLIFNSGARRPGQIKGIYTGTNSHDFTVTFIQRELVTSEILSSSD